MAALLYIICVYKNPAIAQKLHLSCDSRPKIIESLKEDIIWFCCGYNLIESCTIKGLYIHTQSHLSGALAPDPHIAFSYTGKI